MTAITGTNMRKFYLQRSRRHYIIKARKLRDEI